MKLSPRSSIQTQLNVVERALEILAQEPRQQRSPQKRGGSNHNRVTEQQTLQSSASLSRILQSRHKISDDSVEEQLKTISFDESNKIKIPTIQPVVCPDCLDEVDAKNLPFHRNRQCPNKIVSCPNSECGCTMNLQVLKWHLQEECIITKQRKNFLEQNALKKRLKEEQDALRFQELRKLAESKQAASNNTSTIVQTKALSIVSVPEEKATACDQCGEGIKESQLPLHLKEKCPYRKLICPNYGNGCNESSISFIEMNRHLKTGCNAEKWKDKLIERSKLRLEPVQCVTCGEKVPLYLFKRHETELCENRLISCRNSHLGCMCLIPRKERHLHEHVDDNYERFTMFFPGFGSHLAIEETDVTCPWTAEYWIYRPKAVEAMKMHLINALTALTCYEMGYAAEMIIHREVMSIVIALRDDAGRSEEKQEEIRNMTKTDRKQYLKEQADLRANMINEITALIPVYTEAVLSYLKGFQAMAIPIEAALANVREVRQNRNDPWNKERLISLQFDYPGDVAQQGPLIKDFAQDTRSRATTAATSHNGDVSRPLTGVQDDSSRAGSPHQGSANHSRASTSMAENENRGNLNEQEPEVAKFKFNITEASTFALAEGESHVSQLFQYCWQLFLDHKNEEKINAERERNEREERERAEKAEREAQKMAAKVESAAAALEEDEEFADLLNETANETIDISIEVSSGIDWGTLIEDAQKDLKRSNSGEKAEIQSNKTEDPKAVLLASRMKQVLGATHKTVGEFKEFLCAWMEHPFFATQQIMLSLDTWHDVIESFARVLKADFDHLQDLRILAGLLTPEVKGSVKKKTDKVASNNADNAEDPGTEDETVLTAEDALAKQDKYAKKKEKERLRREARKIKKMKQAEEDATKASAAAAEAAEQEAKARNPSAKIESKREIKIITRIAETLRSGCGCELLADCGAENPDGNRSRIYLSMYSGLSILTAEYAPSEDTFSGPSKGTENEGEQDSQDHHYELLLPKSDLKKLMGFSGSVGLTNASPVSISSVEFMGTQASVFNAKVPRGRWTHLAIVTTKAPQNKMTLYMDGAFINALRDCAFPLPMLSLGGSPHTNATFCGVMLDARYWNYPRSHKQIKHFLHRMITLTLPHEMKLIPQDQQQDKGLIAWWTFDDGPGASVVTDVTRHRFKTPLSNQLLYSMLSDCGPRNRYPIPIDILIKLPNWLKVLISAPELMKLLSDVDDLNAAEESVTKNSLGSNEDPTQHKDTDDDTHLESRPGSAATPIEDTPNTSHPSTAATVGGMAVSSSNPSRRRRKKKAKSKFPMIRLLEKSRQFLCKYKWLCAETIKNVVVDSSLGQKAGSKAHSESTGKSPGGGKKPPPKDKKKHQATIIKKKPAIKPLSNAERRSTLPYYLLDELKERASRNGEGPILPIPSYREQNLCPFELRRHRLAKTGRELHRLQPCPLGCPELVKKLNLKFHIRFICTRRLVACRFEFCTGMYPLEEMERHEREECVLVEYKRRAIAQYNDHVQSIPCVLCAEQVPLRELSHHEQSLCIQRLVLCPRNGCSYNQGDPRLPWHQLEHHMVYDCDSTEVTKKALWITRSRSRNPYPRPWGIEIAYQSQQSSSIDSAPEDVETIEMDDETVNHVVGTVTPVDSRVQKNLANSIHFDDESESDDEAAAADEAGEKASTGEPSAEAKTSNNVEELEEKENADSHEMRNEEVEASLVESIGDNWSELLV